ncbi:Mitochondrial import inner membrane translocase subunit TIM50 [Hibiscus syriacus]|uniref:Mitochondrial import inner membrane translocase subunit TIM50 n=1 Tax=Hibiscus syriacus TaxID=106335 RepID=A0A6A3AKB5_HIBSY|nr:Mitochondrial import inner membrane translocase subunit TIM50 [Hibiscus syriacus]
MSAKQSITWCSLLAVDLVMIGLFTCSTSTPFSHGFFSCNIPVPAKALESYLDLRKKVEEHVTEFTEPTSDKLLPDLHPQEQHVFTLVLDLNETLLYTDWKDLSKLNRDPAKILYVSAHAFESSLQPENCVPIRPYKLETDDTVLLDHIPFLELPSVFGRPASADVARNSPADIRQENARTEAARSFLASMRKESCIVE